METAASVNLPQTFPFSPTALLGPHWTLRRRSSGPPPPPFPPRSSLSPTSQRYLQGTCPTSCYLQSTPPAGLAKEKVTNFKHLSQILLLARVKVKWHVLLPPRVNETRHDKSAKVITASLTITSLLSSTSGKIAGWGRIY